MNKSYVLCSMTSPQRRSSFSSTSALTEPYRQGYAEEQQVRAAPAADRPVPRRQLSQYSSSGLPDPAAIPSDAYGDRGHIFTQARSADACKVFKSAFAKQLPALTHHTHQSLTGNLPMQASAGLQQTREDVRPSALASQLDPTPRGCTLNAANHISEEQLFNEAAQQGDPISMSVHASHVSNWHPLMLDSRAGGTDVTAHTHRHQAGNSQRGPVHRHSGTALGLSEPDALGLSGTYVNPPARQPIQASSSSGRHEGLHSGSTAGATAGIAQRNQLERPVSSSSQGTRLSESAADSAAQRQQAEPTEAMLNRIHRSLRATAGRSNPQLQAHSSDTAVDSRPSMKHEQDSRSLSQDATSAAAGSYRAQSVASDDTGELTKPPVCLFSFCSVLICNANLQNANLPLSQSCRVV